MATSSYTTDLTDVQWQRVEALLRASAAHRPGPNLGDGRAAFDALL